MGSETLAFRCHGVATKRKITIVLSCRARRRKLCQLLAAERDLDSWDYSSLCIRNGAPDVEGPGSARGRHILP